MRITYKGDYALKILLDLYLNSEKGIVRIKEIAARQDIPLKYLQQIILTLKGAGYLRTKRGPDGGITAAKNPENVKLGEVIRLMDGTTAPITCVSKTNPSKCAYSSECPLMPIWLDIRDYTNNIVDNTTFADLVNKVNSSKQALNYSV